MDQKNYETDCNRILSRLQTGKKIWFWFCTGNGEQALLLSEISEDPTMEHLTQKIRTTTPVLGVQQYIGLLSITKNGVSEFISKHSSLEMLFEISQWCSRTLTRMPELAIFKNSVMVKAQEDGSIVNRYQDPNLWTNMNKKSILGTTEHAVQQLIELPKSKTAWFAVTKDGDQIRLIAQPVEQDTTGETFANLLKSSSMNHPNTLKGTVLRGEKRLIFTCAKGTGDEQELFSLLQQNYGTTTNIFHTMKLFRMKQTKKKEILLSMNNIEKTEVHAIDSLLLTALEKGDKLFFYFSDNGSKHTPLLLLNTDREKLKTEAKSHPKAQRSLRGSVSKNSKGIAVFQSSKRIDEFVPSLVAWVKKQSKPQHYRTIFGARFIQKNAEGILSKEKNDLLWSSIT